MATPDQNPEKSIPKPPSRAEVDRISQDQALITDEWAPQPSPDGKPEPGQPEQP